MSSKYTTTNLPKNSLKTWFINLIKVLGALVSPEGITRHSYEPYLILNAVFHSSPSLILIWWYLFLKSILENTQAPCNSSRRSSNLEIGCSYLIVILLRALQSVHILQVPSFLDTNITGTTHEIMLSCTHPLLINSLTCHWISSVSWDCSCKLVDWVKKL